MARVPGPVLETERLVLRPPRPRDVGAYWLAFQGEEIARWLAHPAHTREEVAHALARTRTQQRRGDAIRYALYLRADERLVGAITVRHIDRLNARANLAAWLTGPQWGRGLMPEALAAVLRHAFGPLHLHRVYADIMADNRRSARVLEKLGFSDEGTLRRGLRCRDGRVCDLRMFGLLRTDPATARLRAFVDPG